MASFAGSGVRRLTNDDNAKFGPVFARKSNQILFSGVSDPNLKDGYDLFILNMNGQSRKITANAYDNSEGAW